MKHTSIRWSERSLELVQRVAAEHDMSTSEFVREASLVRAAYLLGSGGDERLATLEELAHVLRDELGPF